jgi:hypothetical protein
VQRATGEQSSRCWEESNRLGAPERLPAGQPTVCLSRRSSKRTVSNRPQRSQLTAISSSFLARPEAKGAPELGALCYGLQDGRPVIGTQILRSSAARDAAENESRGAPRSRMISSLRWSIANRPSTQRCAWWDEKRFNVPHRFGGRRGKILQKSRRNRRSLRRVCPNRQMPAVASKITSKTVADC